MIDMWRSDLTFSNTFLPVTTEIPWTDDTVDSRQKISQFFEAMDRILYTLETGSVLRGVQYMLLVIVMVRLVFYLKMHPRVGILVRTLNECADDLFHFCVLFVFVLFVLSTLGCAIFGHTIPEVSSVGKAMHTAYSGFISGEMPDFQKEWQFAIYVMIFTLMVWACLLNFLLAIIVEAYLNAKKQVEEFEAEGNLFADVLDIL